MSDILKRNISFLPLDGRPPNYRFIEQIAEILNVTVDMPPIEIFGNLKYKTDMDGIQNWILKSVPDEFIFSIDTLVYGGLLSSRESESNAESCLKRLALIEKLKHGHPNLTIECFNTIRRISSTVRRNEDISEYKNLLNYFRKNADDYGKSGQNTSDYPNESYLKKYFNLRKRNHDINKKCMDYLAEGIIDSLALVQEDCFPGGPQKSEKEILKEFARLNGLNVRMFIHNGTDEAGQELLLRCLLPETVSIGVFSDEEKTLNRIYDYEDEIFTSNLRSHASLLNMKISTDEKNEFALYVSGGNTEKSVNDLNKLLKEGRKIVLLDLFKPNGGNLSLIRALENGNMLGEITGYSAWNTACNALGTALVQLKLAAGRNLDKRLLKKFYLERLIDDGFYQGEYRQRLKKIVEKSGMDSNYSDFAKHSVIKENVESFEMEMNLFILKNFPEFTTEKIKLGFPWQRLFECELYWV